MWFPCLPLSSYSFYSSSSYPWSPPDMHFLFLFLFPFLLLFVSRSSSYFRSYLFIFRSVYLPILFVFRSYPLIFPPLVLSSLVFNCLPSPSLVFIFLVLFLFLYYPKEFQDFNANSPKTSIQIHQNFNTNSPNLQYKFT